MPVREETQRERICEKFALEFTAHIINEQFDKAHHLLTKKAKQQWSVSRLEEKYKKMTQYFDDSPIEMEYIEFLDNWPDMQPDDFGWIYIAIWNDGASEAVTLIICKQDNEYKISDIAWGRP